MNQVDEIREERQLARADYRRNIAALDTPDLKGEFHRLNAIRRNAADVVVALESTDPENPLAKRMRSEAVAQVKAMNERTQVIADELNARTYNETERGR